MTELKEDDETAIEKPMARRSGLSNHESFSELLSDSVKDSSPADVSETTVIAIRPKTVMFKPTGKVEMLAQKSNATSNLVYKPVAKFVTGATLSVLASLGNGDINPRQEISEVDSCIKTPESNKNDVQVYYEECKPLLLPSNEDRASSDGHSWRKYGQKQVKGSEYPRSYYKCTYPNCLMKKMVGRTFDDQITEVVYKGEHNHSKPQGPAFDAARIEVNSLVSNNQKAYRIGGPSTESKDQISIESFGPLDFLGVSPRINEPVVDVLFDTSASTSSDAEKGECVEGSHVALGAEDDGFISKRRKCETESLKAGSEEKTAFQPGNDVQSNTDSEIIGDGFRWRKYGQKVVKGNSYPRSYYKCTSPKCNVRKYVERTSEDPATFITTYEGRHNHEMPIKFANSDTRTRNKS